MIDDNFLRLRQQKRQRLKRQLGRSMLEMISVLAVFGVIIGGMLSLAGRVFSGRGDATVVAEMVHIVSGAKSLMKWYPEINNTDKRKVLKYMLCQGYVTPNEKITDCSNMNTALPDGTVGILPNGRMVNVITERIDLGSEEKDSCTSGQFCQSVVTLAVSGLTQTECVSLVTTDWGSDFLAMGTTDINSMDYVSSKDYTFPIKDPADILHFCAADKAVGGTYNFYLTLF